MEIKRVMNLGEDEFDTLIAAGELVRSVVKAKDTYDELSEGAKKILSALKDVIDEALNK